ncbi:unnamed protein product [Urochloa decumbens]|uniref:Uncharacterized protein n=1 Tax=Urochloa decumbens TaxID=240449 RepID=A0ABC9F4T7_9POAL
MSSMEMQDSYLSDGLLEAPTMSSKQIKHAREQALKILKTKSPEEALKIFTEGSGAKADHLLRGKVETATLPPNTVDAKPNGAVQQPPNN